MGWLLLFGLFYMFCFVSICFVGFGLMLHFRVWDWYFVELLWVGYLICVYGLVCIGVILCLHYAWSLCLSCWVTLWFVDYYCEIGCDYFAFDWMVCVVLTWLFGFLQVCALVLVFNCLDLCVMMWINLLLVNFRVIWCSFDCFVGIVALELRCLIDAACLLWWGLRTDMFLLPILWFVDY